MVLFQPLRLLTCALLLSLFAKPGLHAEEVWNVYIDADWSHSLNSSQAIEWGFETALARYGERLPDAALKSFAPTTAVIVGEQRETSNLLLMTPMRCWW